MKIPANIKVGGLQFEVRFDKPHANDKDSWGITSYEDQMITLDPNMKKDRQAEVWIHELLHVAWNMAGMADPLPEGTKEEDVINSLAKTFNTLIQDNQLDLHK